MTDLLFDPPRPRVTDAAPADAPLAERLRPRSLDEVVGHEQLVGKDGFLRRAILEDRIPSLIFWGPPGCGKTTLARLIAESTRARFVPFSAVTSGIKEVRQVMADAARLRRAEGRSTLVFVDEIHRFNKAQQDAFLPYVEKGEIVLVGATTENPSFEINAALLSRCRVVVLGPLDREDVGRLLDRAIADSERGLGLGEGLASEGREAIIDLASGDARRALTLLELAVADAEASGASTVDSVRVRRIAQRKTLLYDKAGEEHYNLISALHKSLRESDPDASLYWLERMLAAGEDPRFLARRLVRFASEDVGLADPSALSLTLSAWSAYERLGSPEGELALAEAALFLALAPKSNAVYAASRAARKAVEEKPAEAVPPALRNAPTRLMKDIGYGAGYVYAPDTEEGMAGLECLPAALGGSRFYEPRESGKEQELARRLEALSELRRRLRGRREARAGSAADLDEEEEAAEEFNGGPGRQPSGERS